MMERLCEAKPIRHKGLTLRSKQNKKPNQNGLALRSKDNPSLKRLREAKLIHHGGRLCEAKPIRH